MINQERVRQMSQLAIQERSVKEKKALRVCESRMVDYIIIQAVKGFFAGTVCYAAGLLLWFGYIWDDLNLYFKEAQFMEFLHDVIIRYGIIVVIYMAICGVVAGFYYRRCYQEKHRYIKSLNRLGRSYAREHMDGGEDAEDPHAPRKEETWSNY